MILPPLHEGAAFSEASDGDVRGDLNARASLSEALGVSSDWATVTQIHGNRVVRAADPGPLGEADAVWTTVGGLPIAVFTADCFGVVMFSSSSVGVAHAGWRGARLGVVSLLRKEMDAIGEPVNAAVMGPGIGPCCFEVGDEVSAEFPEHRGETTWGTTSVDLGGALRDQLEGLNVWSVNACTRHEDNWFSHRASATPARLATVGWLA